MRHVAVRVGARGGASRTSVTGQSGGLQEGKDNAAFTAQVVLELSRRGESGHTVIPELALPLPDENSSLPRASPEGSDAEDGPSKPASKTPSRSASKDPGVPPNHVQAEAADSSVGRALTKALPGGRHSLLYKPADFEAKPEPTQVSERRFSKMLMRSLTAGSKADTPKEPVKGLPVINPMNKIKVSWDLFVGALIIYSVLTIPMTLSFSVEPDGAWLIWDISVDIFFGIDIMLCFNTAYKKNGQLVYDKKKIRWNYTKTWFPIDFFSTFPFDHTAKLFTSGDSGNARSIRMIRTLRLSRLMKLARLFKMKRLAEILEVYFRLTPAVMAIWKLMFIVAGIIHFCCCVWYLAAMPICPPSPDPDCNPDTDPLLCMDCTLPVDPFDHNWVRFSGYEYESAGTKYIASFYFTTASMMAVGYGDIYAHTTLERVVSIIIQLMGAGMFGFMMAAITIFLDTHNPKAGEVKKRMAEVLEWAYGREMEKPMRQAVRDHFNYFYLKKSLFDNDEKLNECPPEMRIALLRTIHHERIRSFNFFKVVKIKLVCRLVTHMMPVLAARREIIIEEGDVTRDWYFLAAGRVHALKRHLTTTVAHVHAVYFAGDNFADNVLLNKKADFTYEARNRSNDLLLLPRATVFQVLDAMPEEAAEAKKHWEKHAALLAESVATVGDQGVTSVFASRIVCASPDKHELFQCIESKEAQLDGPLTKAAAEIGGITAENKKAPQAIDPKRMKRAGTKDPKVLKRGKAVKDVKADSFCYRLEQRTLIEPDRPWKLTWDVFLGALIMYSVLMIPMRIGFSQSAPDNSPADNFDIAVDFFFLFDMIFTCRTAIQDGPDQLIRDSKTIAKRYLKSWFVIDALSTFPTDRVVRFFNEMNTEDGATKEDELRSIRLVRTIRLFRLLKLMRLLRMSRVWRQLQRGLDMNPTLLMMLGFFVKLALFAHMIACFWFYPTTNYGYPDYLDTSGDVDSTTWWSSTTEPENPSHFEFTQQYVLSMYWAFTTMTTVGYGDITATREHEMLYSIVIMFIGANTFGYIVGSIAGLAERGGSMDSMVKRRTRDFKDYLEEKIPVTMVPQEIRSGVVKAITKNLEFQTKWDSPYEEKRILSDLPPNLRFSCIEFIHGDQIPDIALFNPRGLSARDPDYQPPAGWFLSAVVEMLKPTFYLLGDHVIDVGDQPESLIFVIEGAAEELYEAERRADIGVAYQCLAVFRERGVIFEPAIRGGTAETFVRSILPLSTLHLERDACDPLEAGDPLLAEALREAIGEAILRQVQDPELQFHAQQRTDELCMDDESGRNERLQIEESKPHWVTLSAKQKDLSESVAPRPGSSSAPARDSGPSTPNPRRSEVVPWRPDTSKEDSESDKPNPQDPEFEDARPPSSPAPLLPGVPGDVTPALMPRAPTR